MSRIVWLTAALVALLAQFPTSLGADAKKEKTENKNTLIAKHKDNLKLSASSTWNGWPVEKLIDGDTGTSWFSAQGDTATKCGIPWVEVEFPEDVTISRVTLLGNREVNWPRGFDVLLGKLELFDKNGKRLHAVEDEGVGEHHDFDFTLKQSVKGVRKVRFTSLKDQGDKNEFSDIGIAELQIE
jgi:hypothetical protein